MPTPTSIRCRDQTCNEHERRSRSADRSGFGLSRYRDIERLICGVPDRQFATRLPVADGAPRSREGISIAEVVEVGQRSPTTRRRCARLHLMALSHDGVEIAYDIRGRAGGAAPTVVLVHGWAGNRTYWASQIDLLAERHQVVALDLGGHGESGVGRGDWNLPAFGDDVVAVIEKVGADDIALVGHSMGGDAIVYAASSLGGRVRGLVWVDAFRSLGQEPTSSPEDVAAFVAPFREDFPAAVDRFARGLFAKGADPALVDRVAADMAAVRRDVALGSLGYALNREPTLLAALATMTAPVIALNPDVAPTNVESLRRHGVKPIVLTGVGHFLMLEDAEQFNAVLVETLASFAR
jgi:pimeloyl-ACP methyl ester carboxylesterase